jgi:hypothetical protein
MSRLPLALACLVCACNTYDLGRPGEGVAQASSDQFRQSLNNKADILFLVDNSGSMKPKQDSLRRYFPDFMEPLKSLPNVPDLHIGIVTSDLGAGLLQPAPGGCVPGGDRGVLQNAPRGDTCAASHLLDPNQRFLTFAPDPDGGPARTNFTGDIADAFACYAAVGEGGCGFEHQLGAVRAALAGCDTPGGCEISANEGFLRPDAYLAVVILTDEDDCSAPADSGLFDMSAAAAARLGPPGSYRCFQYGNLCDGLDPGRTPGPRTDCAPGSPDPDPRYQLTPVEDFAQFLWDLKPEDPRLVYLSTIASPPGPVNVLAVNGVPDLDTACSGGLGGMNRPAPRLAKLVSLFDSDRASQVSICVDDLQQAMGQIAHELAAILAHQCLGAPLRDVGGAAGFHPDCAVTQRTTVDAATGTYQDVAVPPCDPVVCDPATAPGGDCGCARHDLPAGAPGCWYVWANAAACPTLQAGTSADEVRLGSGYQLKIDRGVDESCHDPAPPAGTTALVQCAACAADPAAGRFDCSPECAANWPRCCATAPAPADCLQ